MTLLHLIILIISGEVGTVALLSLCDSFQSPVASSLSRPNIPIIPDTLDLSSSLNKFHSRRPELQERLTHGQLTHYLNKREIWTRKEEERFFDKQTEERKAGSQEQRKTRMMNCSLAQTGPPVARQPALRGH
jgi:hypothetical protein